MACASIYSST